MAIQAKNLLRSDNSCYELSPTNKTPTQKNAPFWIIKSHHTHQLSSHIIHILKRLFNNFELLPKIMHFPGFPIEPSLLSIIQPQVKYSKWWEMKRSVWGKTGQILVFCTWLIFPVLLLYHILKLWFSAEL